jgi:hypothetical protein
MRSSLVVLLGFAAHMVSADFYNNVPIPGRRPAFVQGTAAQGIDLQIVYDLMCSDSAALHPEFQKFLDMTWNVTNTKVSEAIQVTYTFLPLPYHHEVWIPHLLVPFFIDECQFPSEAHPKCQFMDYMLYCFANQDAILGAKDTAFNALVLQWTSQVATALGLTQAELLTCYNSAYDTHDSEWRTRVMYKFNTAGHNSGTPFGYVNGILLENYPSTADQWMEMLQSVYGDQYRPAKASIKRDQ